MDIATSTPRVAIGSRQAVAAAAHRQRVAASRARLEAEQAQTTQLQALYQQALQAHADGQTKEADALYTQVLSHALLSPSSLHAGSHTALRARGDHLDEAAAEATAQRLTLRFLALKNQATLNEEQATKENAAGQSPEAQQEQSTPGAQEKTADSRWRCALQLGVDALDIGATLVKLQARLRAERARIESGSLSGSDSEHKASSSEALPAVPVADVALWLQTGRAALQLGQLALARRAAESVLQLRSNSWPAMELLADVLFLMDDVGALQPLLRHALALDPWHVKCSVLQRRLWQSGRCPPPAELEDPAAGLLEERLSVLMDSATVQAAEATLDALKRRAEQQQPNDADPRSAPHVLLLTWECKLRPPCFTHLAQQIAFAYSEDVPTLGSALCVVSDEEQLVAVPPALNNRPRFSLTLPVTIRVVESATGESAPSSQADDEAMADGAASEPSASPVQRERQMVIDFLRQHAWAMSPLRDAAAATLVACTPLPALALALLDFLTAHSAVIDVDPAAALCLVHIVLNERDNNNLDASDEVEENASAPVQLQRYLRWAELALEARQQQQRSSEAQASAKRAEDTKATAVEIIDLSPPVIDLTQPGATLSPPPPAVFHAPPRWKGRHPSALRVAQQCVGHILAQTAADSIATKAAAPTTPAEASFSSAAVASDVQAAPTSSSVPALLSPAFADDDLQRRWSQLLTALQTAVAEDTARPPATSGKSSFAPIRHSDTKVSPARASPYQSKLG